MVREDGQNVSIAGIFFNSQLAVGDGNIQHLSLIPKRNRRKAQARPQRNPLYEDRQEWRSKLQSFLDTAPSGYFILDGPAGVGKTEFLREAALSSGSPLGLVSDDSSIGNAIVDLASGMVEKYELDTRLLSDISESGKRQEVGAELKAAMTNLIIEAGRHTQDKVLLFLDGFGRDSPNLSAFLPRQLPDNTYILIGQRQGASIGSLEGAHVIDASATSDIGEMQNWIRRALLSPRYNAALQDCLQEPDTIAEHLARKSRGAWIYAHYVLEGARLRQTTLSELSSIPNDLWAYYRHFLVRWAEQREEEWARTQLPVLAVLAAAPDDMGVDELLQCTLGSAPNSAQSKATQDLLESWSPFVQRTSSDTYTAYHPSFVDFLSGRRPAAIQTTSDGHLRRRLRQAHELAHRQLGAFCRSVALAPSTDAGRSPLDARLQAVHHYTECNDHDQVSRLLFEISGSIESYGAATTYRNLAFEAFRDNGATGQYISAVDSVSRTLRRVPGVGSELHLRYALAVASLSQMASNLPAELLKAGLKHEVWGAEEVLLQIFATPQAWEQQKRLAAVGPHMPTKQLREVAEELGRVAPSEVAATFLRGAAGRLDEISDGTMQILLSQVEASHLLEVTEAIYDGSARCGLALVKRLTTSSHTYWTWTESNGRVLDWIMNQAEPSQKEAVVVAIMSSKLDYESMALALGVTVVHLPASAWRENLLDWILARLPSGGRWSQEDLHVLGNLASLRPSVIDRSEAPEQSPALKESARPGARRGILRLWSRPAIAESLERPKLPPPSDSNAIAAVLIRAIERTTDSKLSHDWSVRAFWLLAESDKNEYTRSRLLVRLARCSARDVPDVPWLEELPDLYGELQGAYVSAIADTLSHSNRAAVLDWAFSYELPRNCLILPLVRHFTRGERQNLLYRSAQGEPEHRVSERCARLLMYSDSEEIGGYIRHVVNSSMRQYFKAARLSGACASVNAEPKHLEQCLQWAFDQLPTKDGLLHTLDLIEGILPKVAPSVAVETLARVEEAQSMLLLFRGASLLNSASRSMSPADIDKYLRRIAGEDIRVRASFVDAIAPFLTPELVLTAAAVVQEVRSDFEWTFAAAAVGAHASRAGGVDLARAVWPHRTDAPSGFWDVFAAACRNVHPTDRDEMISIAISAEPASSEEHSRVSWQTRTVLRATVREATHRGHGAAVAFLISFPLLNNIDLLVDLLEVGEQELRGHLLDVLLGEWAEACARGVSGTEQEAMAAVLQFVPADDFLKVVLPPPKPPTVAFLRASILAWPESATSQLSTLVPYARQAQDGAHRLEADLSDGEFVSLDGSLSRYVDSRCEVLCLLASRLEDSGGQDLLDEAAELLFGVSGKAISDYSGTSAQFAGPASAQCARRLRDSWLATGDRLPTGVLALLAANLPLDELADWMAEGLRGEVELTSYESATLLSALVERNGAEQCERLLEVFEATGSDTQFASLVRDLAPMLSSRVAGRALARLDEGMVDEERGSRGLLASTELFLSAKVALSRRISRDRRARVLSEVLAATCEYTRLDRNTNGIRTDLSYGDSRGRAPWGRSLSRVQAGVVLLAVAKSADGPALREEAVNLLVDGLAKVERHLETVELLSEAARLVSGELRERVESLAFIKADECSIWDNDRAAAMLSVAKLGGVAATRAYAEAVCHYEFPEGYHQVDSLGMQLTQFGASVDCQLDEVVSVVAERSRGTSRAALLNRVGLLSLVGGKRLGADWADSVSRDLVLCRQWWP